MLCPFFPPNQVTEHKQKTLKLPWYSGYLVLGCLVLCVVAINSRQKAEPTSPSLRQIYKGEHPDEVHKILKLLNQRYPGQKTNFQIAYFQGRSDNLFFMTWFPYKGMEWCHQVYVEGLDAQERSVNLTGQMDKWPAYRDLSTNCGMRRDVAAYTRLKKLIANLPLSKSSPLFHDAVIVSFVKKSKWHSEFYSRTNPPAQLSAIAEVLRLEDWPVEK